MKILLRKMYGGGLKPSDPRRFLVETMVGAMHADGEVDPAEEQVLRNLLEEHDLFAGLGPELAADLIKMGTDSILFAGGIEKRVHRIAKGLPGRSHRLTAYAVACEVCQADHNVGAREMAFLEKLKEALGISDVEARELFEASRNKGAMALLEEKTRKMRELMPQFVRCMTLMAAADGHVDESEQRAIRRVLRKVPDMDLLDDEELERTVDASFRRIKGKRLDNELMTVAAMLDSSSDRFWAYVYMSVIALADGNNDMAEVEFMKNARRMLRISEDTAFEAGETARRFVID